MCYGTDYSDTLPVIWLEDGYTKTAAIILRLSQIKISDSRHLR